MAEEDDRRLADWLDRLFWLSRDLQSAAELIRSVTGSSERDQPPENLSTLDGTEYGTDLAVGHLQNARFASLIVSAWLDFDSEYENFEADELRRAVPADVLATHQPEALAITREADRRWMRVQDRLRALRRAYFQRRGAEDLSPILDELESDAVRLESEAGRLADAADALWEARVVETPPFRPAAWFDKATGGHLNSDTLRKAGKDGRLQRERVQGRWHYAVPQARKCWPHLAAMIDQALAREEQAGRKRNKPEI